MKITKLKQAQLKKLREWTIEQVKYNRHEGSEVHVYTFHSNEEDEYFPEVVIKVNGKWGEVFTPYDLGIGYDKFTEDQSTAYCKQIMEYLAGIEDIMSDYNSTLDKEIGYQYS